MTPQEAKTKITQLLDLGTLQGVRVEYKGKDENERAEFIFMSPGGTMLRTGSYNQDCSTRPL